MAIEHGFLLFPQSFENQKSVNRVGDETRSAIFAEWKLTSRRSGTPGPKKIGGDPWLGSSSAKSAASFFSARGDANSFFIMKRDIKEANCIISVKTSVILFSGYGFLA